jgi:two-component system chemotaxis sensor kinase CheA
VEKVLGQREVVVRAIRDPLIQVPGISGATEIGDGKPVLILDGTALTAGNVRPAESLELAQNKLA